MSKFQNSRMVMEKFLRRSFYDAVLELYEGAQGTRIISISLEGNLSLIVNKEEHYLIKLNEIAQRADDRDLKPLKFELTDGGVKLEDDFIYYNEGGELKCCNKQDGSIEFDPNQNVKEGVAHSLVKGSRPIEEPVLQEQGIEIQEQSRMNETQSLGSSSMKNSVIDDVVKGATTERNGTPMELNQTQVIITSSGEGFHDNASEICLVALGQLENKRKAGLSDQDHGKDGSNSGQKSAKKRQKIASKNQNVDEFGNPSDEKVSKGSVVGGRKQVSQMLPHTATDPKVVEEEEEPSGGGLTESQIAQLAMFQLRGGEPGLLRPSELEELARQQQQWQIVAYQRTLMENLQQYQLDSERLRWDYQQQLSQQAVKSEEAGKAFSPPAAPVVVQASMQLPKEGAVEVERETEKLPTQLAKPDEQEVSVPVEVEAGEVRPDSQTCFLCQAKFMSTDQLTKHMEKHSMSFERSCSVCQSGTLTGHMLMLHMEASHGPESPAHSPDISVPSVSAAEDMTLPQDANKTAPSSEVTKPDEQQPVASTSREEDAAVNGLGKEQLLSLPTQYYPLVGCQVCGEKFALSEALDQHVENQHKDTQIIYSCKTCSLEFPSHAEYSKHMVRHEASSSNLKCSHCLKSFKSVKQLKLHYVAAHACCHYCEYCRAGFEDSLSLQLHEQIHTLDPEKLTYRCDICSKAFYTQSQCSAHKRTHKDEKAHACEVCGSAFFKRGDLTKHVRTVHSPSRLFSCKFCGKKGTRMDNMRSHVRSHHKNLNRDQIVNMIEVIE